MLIALAVGAALVGIVIRSLTGSMVPFILPRDAGQSGHFDTGSPTDCLTFHRYLGVVAKLFRVQRQLAKALQSIETSNPIEARRARYAQFRGQKATLTLMGATVTGLVRSVREDATSVPPRWIVTVVGMQAAAA
jgi:hypothetical protein